MALGQAPFGSSRGRALAAAALGSALSWACQAPAGGPPLGYEADDLACEDGVDNDQDGLVDCMDVDCRVASTRCGERVPVYPHYEAENAPAVCHDLVDNDDDGLFDCGDRSCSDVPETCCRVEFSDRLCSDGIDNDSNGYTDCAEFMCKSGFVAVCMDERYCKVRPDGSVVADDACCKDGKDSDGDGKTDCADSNCFASDCPKLPEEESMAACSDGLDNDNDGYKDCDDFSCKKTNPDAAVIAMCAAKLGAAVPESTEAACMNGKDDDLNGYTDCGDFSCSGLQVEAVQAYCEAKLENTFAKCEDGKDNDGNGYTDCDDRSCRAGYITCTDSGLCGYFTTKDVATARACVESVASSVVVMNELCSNGVDEDHDGFVDCADFDCARAPGVTVCADKPRMCGAQWK